MSVDNRGICGAEETKLACLRNLFRMTLFICRLLAASGFKVDYAPILLDRLPHRCFSPTPTFSRAVVHIIQFVTTYRMARWGMKFRDLTVLIGACVLILIVFERRLCLGISPLSASVLLNPGFVSAYGFQVRHGTSDCVAGVSVRPSLPS